MQRGRSSGFSLIEVLLVLAIIGILSGIAIPAFSGQRHRARMIADAKTSSQVLSMALETHRADTGLYGAEATYKWTASAPTHSSFLPAFKLPGKMPVSLTIGSTGLTYVITVTDPNMGGASVFKINQAGSILLEKVK